jgi:polygalacturonase
MPGARFHPLVWAVNASNVSVAGSGTINGAGIWWWRQMTGNERPHIMEMHNVSGVDISGVTLQNSAFWTLRPWLCTNVHIHDMKILAPWPTDPGGVLNADGVDVDSSQDVVIERNFISCGDDHVTVLAGAGAAGRAFGMPSRNVTVREHMNKAADHDAFTRKVTDAYTVARGEVTNASGTPFVFVHFGFSKNKRGFKDAVAAGGCGAWGAYTARFDGAQQVVTVEPLSLAAAGAAGAAGGGGVGTG